LRLTILTILTISFFSFFSAIFAILNEEEKKCYKKTRGRNEGTKAIKKLPLTLPVARRSSLLVVQSSSPDTACRAQIELAGGAVLLARHCLSRAARVFTSS
jgi:hypothetical protein